jgi:hypothetical protein
MGVIIMEPLRGGNLAGKVAPAIQALWDEAVTERSAVEWSLRWIWNHLEVTVVLSGMNEEDHIDENLRIANEAYPGSLTDTELALVDRVGGDISQPDEGRLHRMPLLYALPGRGGHPYLF